MKSDVQEYCRKFSLVDNALQMRTLVRWNGRDLREKENLAEHTHLVICCVYAVLDELKYTRDEVNVANIIYAALHHDALELLRGDILSITKDAITGLRYATDKEEEEFMATLGVSLKKEEASILHLADLMACYKFVEWELRYPSNEFAKKAYIDTLQKYKDALEEHCNKYCRFYNVSLNNVDSRFMKGYASDAGTDIILDEDVTFMPMSTSTIDLNVQITPKKGQMSFLCARTSAANKGLSVATCPIDPDYTGNVSAIVHNMSNDIITYKRGESFCQYVTCTIITDNTSPCKKSGERTTSKLGGTDVSIT